jgi:hypothetical protein
MKRKMKLSLVVTALLGLLAVFGSAEAKDANLVAHWMLDEDTGSITYDSAGGNDGTLNGDPNWTTGQVDGALEFDGLGDHVSFSNNAVTTTELTLSAWANPYGPGGGAMEQNVIFCQRDNTGGSNHSVIFLSTEVYYNLPYASARIRSSSGPRQDLEVPMKDYNEWHHYALTVDSNDLIFYIDGVEVVRAANAQSGNYVTAIDQVYIAKHWYGGRTEGLFNGAIDEVRIYDRALSAEEVELIYYWTGPTPSEQAIMTLEEAIVEKLQALESIDAALEKEWETHDVLEEMLASGDYEVLSKRDIDAAQRKIESAIRRQKRSKRVVWGSIEELEDALLSLGWEPEPEPNEPIPEPNVPGPGPGKVLRRPRVQR